MVHPSEPQPDGKPAGLISPALLRQLDKLDVVSRKLLSGKLQGERRSKQRGQSVEFADFRNYVVGDDLRRIDWNLYARLDKLFLRLFLEEQDLTVTLLIDATASMNYGEPNKLLYAKKLAAALGYIGLSHHNRVSVYTFADGLKDRLINLRGKRPVPQLLNFLEAIEPIADAPGNLTESAKQLALQQPAPGVVIVLSDWFDKGEIKDAVRYLALPRFDTYALQILSPQEKDPLKMAQFAGDLSLQDIEDDHLADVSISGALINRYKANLTGYLDHVQTTCSQRGILHMLADTSVPFEQIVLKQLRERGMVG